MLREQKGSTQPTTGANIRYFVTTHPGEFLWQGQTDLPSPMSPLFGDAGVTVTATAAHTDSPIGDIVVEYYWRDGGVWKRRLKWGPDTGSHPNLIYFTYRVPGLDTGSNEVKWFVWISAVLDTEVAIKVQVLGVDQMTISAERTL